MNKTKIEWCDYTWNPIKGYCPNNCPYCYAHRMYERFKWNREIRLDEKELWHLNKITEPSRVFVGSTIDMYHSEINTYFIRQVIDFGNSYDFNTLITLTKFPGGLKDYHFNKWWWVGTTIDRDTFGSRAFWLRENQNIDGKRFISFEPLLSNMYRVPIEGIDWIIIGGLTPKPVHKKGWIDDIVNRADALNIPVFIKDNAHYPTVRRRREFPNIVV